MGELLQQIQAQSQNLNPGDLTLTAIYASPAAAKILFFVKMIFYVVSACVAIYVFWKMWLQYKVKVTVYKRVGGGGIETVSDRAKIVTDKEGRVKLQLLKTRNGKTPVTCPVPEDYFKSKEGKNDHYNMWLDNNRQIHPIMPPRVEENHPYFKVIPEERKAWSRQERRQIETQYKKNNWLDKYLPQIVVMSSFMIAFLIIFFVSKDVTTYLSQVAGEFGRVADACLQLK